MPNPNAIVGNVIAIEPPDRPEGGQTIVFEGDRRARLDPEDRRSRGYVGILQELRKLQTPAYAEVDPNAGAITFLLIPTVSRVVAVGNPASDPVAVELELSHARHVLRRSNPYFDEIHSTLRDAMAKRSWVAVTENDGQIIDARSFRPPAEGSIPVPPQPTPKSFFRWVRDWFRRLFWFRRCVSRRRAQELFDLCAAQTCDPLTVPVPCIPFMYPDDGCWGRAHEMCRLMINAGARPRKVWIDGGLHTLTRNNPQCFVDWYWHVAPTLCVRRWWWWCFFFGRQEQVIDPSLFTGPVSKATWKGVQGDPTAVLTPTAASVFMRPSQTDPTYTSTNTVLANYRLQLQLRSLNVGPPPYAQCP